MSDTTETPDTIAAAADEGATAPVVDLEADPTAEAPPGTPVLQLPDFRVSFPTMSGDVQAVRGIDLEVNAGELVAIVGESGSGKSVTFLGLMGLLPSNTVHRRLGQARRVRAARRQEEDRPAPARPADGDDLPGPAVGAQPGASHRPPDRRDDPLAPGHEQERGDDARPSSCSTWSASRSPRSARGSSPTSSPAACASG